MRTIVTLALLCALGSTVAGAQPAATPATPAPAATGSITVVSPAQATRSPIFIDSCRIAYVSGPLFTKYADGVQIKFTNEGSLTATNIRVGVVLGTNVVYVRDVGTFSPDIDIDHHFRELTGQNIRFLFSHEQEPDRCFAQEVTFSDGTRWVAPDDQTLTTPAASSAPVAPVATTVPLQLTTPGT